MSISYQEDFKECADIKFISKLSGKSEKVEVALVAEVTRQSNMYLANLNIMFSELGFDIYEILGQRNLSGFVGEVFVRSFSRIVDGFRNNPHADGRPDLLDISANVAETFLKNECFNADGMPVRSFLAPFKYGGIEVKCTIGTPVHDHKKKLQELHGVKNFEIGMPRINFLKSLTYWGHHTSCENLLGVYYDYVAEHEGVPQIMMIMHSELEVETDWNAVSIGKKGSKKTSNTSLTKPARDKLLNKIVVIANSKVYIDRISGIGGNI
tara:strand:- start:3086 stop:3886 length:801 start_codon:yes stop_codon:yes gene_type:complete